MAGPHPHTPLPTNQYCPLIPGHVKDVDADCGRFHVEVVLYYHGNVPLDAILCVCRSYIIWLRETWREFGQVSLFIYNLSCC